MQFNVFYTIIIVSLNKVFDNYRGRGVFLFTVPENIELFSKVFVQEYKQIITTAVITAGHAAFMSIKYYHLWEGTKTKSK